MKRFSFWALALSLSTVLACAADTSTNLKTGDASPDWANLPGTDDAKHSLADYKDAKVLAVVFTCNHCPVATAYENRLIALQKDYKEKGVQLVAINCNKIGPDRLDKMKVRAKEKGFNFPYLYDESQASGRAYGALVTPHVFLLDSARKVVYQGAVDDNMNKNKVQQHFARDALDAVLAGKTPAKAQTTAFGCTIKYEKADK